MVDPDKDIIHSTTIGVKNNDPSSAPDDYNLEANDPFAATRPLPDEVTDHGKKRHIMFGHATDRGVIRSENEDAIVSFLSVDHSVQGLGDFGIFAVADGMGGYLSGEKASALAIRVLIADLITKLYLPFLQTVNAKKIEQPDLDSILQQAVLSADQQIRKNLVDSGTTVTIAVIIADTAYIAHVGDCRAYLITSGGSVQRITRDHTKVQRLIELGQISEEEAEFHEERNKVYRALGRGADEVVTDIERRRLIPGGYLLLCSDGLWNMVRPDEISEIVIHTASPQEACEKLITRANAYGGLDNISAILIKIPNS